MDAQYEAYLNSDEWSRKRGERLAMSGGRCSACLSRKEMQVHHLTYERIFREEMTDLLPLCRMHHEHIEALISKGMLPRKGNVLFLASETIRLILSTPCKKTSGIPVYVPLNPVVRTGDKKPKKKTPKSNRASNDAIRDSLVKDAEFMRVAHSNNRSHFKKACRKLLPKSNLGRFMTQALIIHASIHRYR